jgi:2-polyprenyl-3-methyl-5-hydroxy-6-metoxy-1,4-benzoquinol methylase
MIDRNDVIAAYRLILGREPENEEVVTAYTKQATSLSELRAIFLHSTEFAATPLPNSVRYRPLEVPPMEVETECSADRLTAMMAHIEADWTQLGDTEPHWSVRAEDAFLATNIETTSGDFYESGKLPLARFRTAADRCGVALSALSRCCELGCGVGRTTIWLAETFPQVIAADMSLSHIEIAQSTVKARGRRNVEFSHLSTFGAIDALPSFDVFFSVIVLQHNPPPVIAYLLRTLLSKLRPGGVGYFQVPTYSAHYRFSVDEYLKHATNSGAIEMHVLPQPALFKAIADAGCQMLEMREDAWAGDLNTISNSILAIKL